MIATQSVIDHFGSVKKVAEFFDIEVTAVYQWGKHIPKRREYELNLRMPETFPPKIPEAA